MEKRYPLIHNRAASRYEFDLGNGARALIEEIRRVQAYLPAGSIWLSPLLRCCAVAVLVRVGAELCRDAGEGSLAAKVELCGVVAVLTIALPLLRYLMQLLAEFV